MTFCSSLRLANIRAPSAPQAQGSALNRPPPITLITCLQGHRDEVLRFITDLQVPFDNHLAERDSRMPKLKHKVSGGFRAVAGAQAFATIRSHLSALQKQTIDVCQALVLTFQVSHPCRAWIEVG